MTDTFIKNDKERIKGLVVKSRVMSIGQQKMRRDAIIINRLLRVISANG